MAKTREFLLRWVSLEVCLEEKKKAQEPISAGSLSPKLRGYEVILGASIKGGVVEICRRGEKCVYQVSVSQNF